MRTIAATLLILSVLAASGPASGRPLPEPGPVAPAELQEAMGLGRIHTGVIPPDGLVTLGLGLRTYTTVHLIDGQLQRLSQKDVVLQAGLGLLPWLHLEAEVPWRSWSDGKDWIPETGSGPADGSWLLAAGRGFWNGRIGLALGAGGNLPTGSKSNSLTEGVFSPRAGGTLTVRFWERASLPEMRLHLHADRTWNKAEDTGYGVTPGLFQPWPGRYPAADPAGDAGSNDQVLLGAALEFRKAATTLWLEYSRERLPDHPQVSDSEQLTAVCAGLRWGLVEGWALHGKYLVSLTEDDPATEWYPAYPEWMMSVAVSKQFSFGGRDRDGDGIPDRADHCPRVAEDRDGFADQDGCPEWDNDGDGIPDAQDGAPDLPEDFDGYMDEDGIPDYDNDGDGIEDRKDLCPDEPEDYDGRYDKDGCPDEDLDADGDGVQDDQDRCPDAAEDMDGFEDDDGCPEEDNDLDGIPDQADACPDQAEDYDGVDDGDGCPDDPGPAPGETPASGEAGGAGPGGQEG